MPTNVGISLRGSVPDNGNNEHCQAANDGNGTQEVEARGRIGEDQYKDAPDNGKRAQEHQINPTSPKLHNQVTGAVQLADQVSGPTKPSAASPFSDWKLRHTSSD